MHFLPVAMREARAASRQWRSYYFRLAIAATFFLIILIRLNTPRAMFAGQSLFVTLTMMAFVYCIAAGSLRASDSLAREKREGTLGLLLLTDLKPFQILFGKLIASTAITIFGLLAIIPMLGIPVMLGGITAQEYFLVALNLLNTLFLSIAWGLFISSIARKHLTTVMLALARPIFFGGILMQFGDPLDRRDPSVYPLVLLAAFPSPALPHLLAIQPDPESHEIFWAALAFNHTLAWLWLYLAALFFSRGWQELPSDSRFVQASTRWFNAIRFGSIRQRAAIRRRLFDDNPLFWLANRDRITSAGLMVICLVVLATSYLLKTPDLGFMTACLAIFFRMANSASHAISEDQKSGALELLLSTGLRVPEIIAGRQRAMFRQFFGPILIVILWSFLFVLPRSDSLMAPLVFSSCALLIATGFALAWVGPWFALRKRPAAATWTSLAVVALPPWLIWFASIAPSLFDPSMKDIHFIGGTVCAWIGVGHCIPLIFWGREKLFRNFREAAADPFAVIQFEPTLPSLVIEYRDHRELMSRKEFLSRVVDRRH